MRRTRHIHRNKDESLACVADSLHIGTHVQKTEGHVLVSGDKWKYKSGNFRETTMCVCSIWVFRGNRPRDSILLENAQEGPIMCSEMSFTKTK